jgi:outer membrane protein OmpA-like peptidoglycan-associated protein
MTARQLLPRLLAFIVLSLAALLLGCASAGPVPAGRLTPVKDRVTDESMARDLRLLSRIEREVVMSVEPATAQRVRAARRALAYVALAREAYERSDRTSFADDALAWARIDLETLRHGADAALTTSVVPMPPEQARRDHPFLGGPACAAEMTTPWERTLKAFEEKANALVVKAPPPPAPLEDRPLPVRPDRCGGPERLTGVPGSVHFALDRAVLSTSAQQSLDRAVSALAPYASVRVRLSGHTDVRASQAYNQALSERRVNAVRDYLVARGVSVERLETSALGETAPLAAGSSVRDHARNRRVELHYVLCDGSEVPLDEELSDLQLEAMRRRQAQREKD